MSKIRVLVIEDDVDLSSCICDFLNEEGNQADAALDGITGLHLAVTNQYDVIVLDINLPGMDGLTLSRQLRSNAASQVPILMLTARDAIPDKLAGFAAGADDYMVKPFDFRELFARLWALSKRIKKPEEHILQVADLTFNCQTQRAFRAGQALELTPISCKILELLLRHSPHVVSRQQIEHVVWGLVPADGNALRSHMHYLRNCVDKPFAYPLIHTVHGIGFKLISQEQHGA